MIRRSRRLPRMTRDGALFCVGLLGLAHETLIASSERPTLIFAFMAMVGLPAFLRADEKRQNADESDSPSSKKRVSKRVAPKKDDGEQPPSEEVGT